MEAETPAGLLLRWLGVAGLELRAGLQTLLIDPFVSRPGLRDTARGRLAPDPVRIAEMFPAVDQVLVTHAHWDHLLDVPEILRQTGAVGLGSANVCQLLAVWGLPASQVRVIEAGERLDLGHFSVEVLPARHLLLPGFGNGALTEPVRPPRRAREYRMDACFSFLLTIDGLRILDWTSQRPGPAPRADLLLVKLVGSGRHFKRLLRAVQPSLVLPMHWDNPFGPKNEPGQVPLRRSRWLGPLRRLVDPGQFESWLEVLAPGVRVQVPEVGRCYDVHALLEGGSLS